MPKLPELHPNDKLARRLMLLGQMFAMIKEVPNEWLPSKKHADDCKNGINLINLPPPELGRAAYLGIVGEFLEAVAPYTEAVDVAVLAHLLPALGAMMGPIPFTWAGGEQRCVINTLLVGPTSTGRKGTSFVPVDKLMNEIDPTFWASQFVSGLSSGEGLINKVADKKTWEKDGEEIVEVDKRLYVKESEFSRVLAQAKRDGNILSQVMREAFDSGKLGVLTRNVPLEVKGAHIAITGHITPEELLSNFDRIDIANGFLNRFIFIFTRSNKEIPFSKPIPDSLIEDFATRLRMCMGLAKMRGATELSDAAKLMWMQLYPQLRKDEPGIVGALTARGTAFVLRIALIYTIITKSKKIETLHLAAAMAVWKYNLASIQILFSGKNSNSLADKIVTILSSGPKKTTEFHSHLSKPAKEIRIALGELEKADRVKCEKPEQSGPGRPMEIWSLVD